MWINIFLLLSAVIIVLLLSAVIIADAYMVAHGYKPWLFNWSKKDDEMPPAEKNDETDKS